MSLAKRIALVLVALAVAGAAWWWFTRGDQGPELGHVILHGNVDIREVELAFNGTERITALHATEGQQVAAGELLGELETERLAAEFARAEAELAAQDQEVARLEAGSRPEEIRKARADVAAAEADLADAQLRLARTRELVPRGALPQERLDSDQAAADAAEARLAAARAALDLALAGSRVEDIAAARARRDALRAALALARKRLDDAKLYAPAPGVIRNRVLEPGDMASPQQPAYTLALTDPLWVRAYVEEPDLGRIQPGQEAWISTDSFPGKRYSAWIGYVSPTAEFTPKSVETREVRSHLVYQVRVYACNPEGELRLGMPATVTVDVTRAPVSRPGCRER